jgi:hypothetical protein
LNSKRKQVEELIYKVIGILDKSGENLKRYKSVFSGMTDEAFDKTMKKFLADDTENFYLEIVPFESEPKMEDIKEAADYLKVPLEEYVYMPYINNDAEDPIRTAYPVPVG